MPDPAELIATVLMGGALWGQSRREAPYASGLQNHPRTRRSCGGGCGVACGALRGVVPVCDLTSARDRGRAEGFTVPTPVTRT